MVTFSGDRGAPTCFFAASGGTPGPPSRRQPDAARTRLIQARRAQAADEPKGRQVCRSPCKTQVGRAPQNQHQALAGVCGDDERSSRRDGERTARRPDRHTRRAHRAEWCRLSRSAGWVASEGSECKPITSDAAPGGTPTKDVEAVPSVAAEARAKAATMARQMQQLPHPQQQQQLAAAAPLSKSEA